jgi:hypothetical protein
VVGDSVITLEGMVGAYEVSSRKKAVFITINGDEFEIKFDQVNNFLDEIRALARGVAGMQSVGPEMW